MNNIPTFSLAYTSVRSVSIAAVVKLWNDRAFNHDHEWVVCVDEGDAQCLAAAQKASEEVLQPDRCRGLKIVVNKGSKNSVTGWNAACAHTTGQIIIVVADDFAPPLHWDTKLLSLEPAGWETGEHVVHTEDGYVHDIIVLPILTRKRYERYGYLYYPKYSSMFCDTELTEVAYRDGVVIEAKHLLFEHMHPDCGKRARDTIDLQHASTERWKTGEMLFHFRKRQGFPLDDGPKAVQETAHVPVNKTTKFAVYMQVTKDDLCLEAVCKRMMEEGCTDFFLAIPDEYWSGEPVTDEERATLNPVIENLTKAGANVRTKTFKVKDYRVKDDTRITVETRVRNDSLQWVRSSGFEHVLIVDGDELWLPGTLDIVRPYVEQGHMAVSCRMVPVLGNPGYPVDFATDCAVVYIGPKCNFRVCRTPTAKQTVIDMARVIHFTSTRRSMEENIKKHKRSGHYDDPDYAFDDWMEKTLPNVHPGMRNAHMYRKFQIWPVVRAWRPEELATIPKELHQYLGT